MNTKTRLQAFISRARDCWDISCQHFARRVDRLLLIIINRDLILLLLALVAGVAFGKVIVIISGSLKMLAGLMMALLGLFFLMRLGEIKRPLVFGLVMSFTQLLVLNPWEEFGAFIEADKPGFPITLPFLLGFALCAYHLAETYWRKTSFDLYWMVTAPFGLMVLWAMLTFFIAPRQDYVVSGYPGVLAAFFVYLYGANSIKTNKEIDFLVFCIAVAVLFQGLLGVYQNVTGNPGPLQFFGSPAYLMQKGGTNRAAGTLGHPNAFALFLAMFLPVLYLWIITTRNAVLMLFYGIAAGFGTIAMLVANSRGVWAGFGLALMVIGLAMVISPVFRRHFIGFGHRIAILGIGGSILAAPLLPRIIERITGDDHGSAESRVPLANMAKQMIGDHPLTGVGLGNYRIAVLDYGPNSWYFDETGYPYAVHNMYLFIIAEVGLVAFSLFLVASAGFLFQGLRVMFCPNPKRALFGVAMLGGLAAIYLSTKSEDLGMSGERFVFLAYLGGLVTGALGGRKAQHRDKHEYGS